MSTLLPEQTVRYLVGPLGMLGTDAEVTDGDLGRVLGPAPDAGWWLTEPAKYPGKICPVSRGMVEAV